MWSKKPRPVANCAGAGLVEVDGNGDLRLLGVAGDGCAARGVDKLAGDFRPAECLAVVAQAADAKILCQCHVGLAVADDGGLFA
jgi:hypothetical protein